MASFGLKVIVRVAYSTWGGQTRRKGRLHHCKHESANIFFLIDAEVAGPAQAAWKRRIQTTSSKKAEAVDC